ncbi:MAG: extracellular solute-binding protein [Bacillota bacterium]
MQKIHKIISIILIISLLVVCFSACSGSQTIIPTPTEGIINATNYTVVFGDNLTYDTSLEINDGDSITISFWFPTDVESICEEYVEKYKDIHKNVTFKTKSYPWDEYWTELTDALEGGTGPDIYWMNTAYQSTLIEYANPLSEENFPKDDMELDFRNFYAHAIDDEIYFVDLGYTAPIMFYNKTLWGEAGYSESDLPTTWSELIVTSLSTTTNNILGETTVSGFDFSGSNNFLTILTAMNYQSGEMQYSYGGEETNFYNDICIENMEYLSSFINSYGISTYTSVANRDKLGYEQTVMICDYTWVYLYMQEVYPDIEIGVFAMPEFIDAPAISSMYSDVSPCISCESSQEKIEASEDFLKFLLSYDNFIKDYSLANALYPSKYSLDDDKDILADPVLSVLSETIDRTILIAPPSATIESIKTYYLQTAYLSGAITAEDATMQTDIECKSALSQLDYESLEKFYKYIIWFYKSDEI